MRLPAGVMLEIFGDMFGNQDVTGIPAIHYTLRNVDASSGDVRAIVYIGNEVDWTAVDAHSQLQLRATFYRLGDL